MIEKIRATKDWRARADIAADEWPGTAFDGLFAKAKTAWEMEAKFPTITAQILQKLEAKNPVTAQKIRKRLGARTTLGEMRAAWENETGYCGIPRQIHEQLGAWLALVIQKREVQKLHNMADALAKLKRHRPKRDYDLETLFSMSGMFPPGWTKTWWTGRFDPKTKRPIFGVKPGTRDKIAMRDIKENLARIDPNFSEETWEARRRKIQRYAKQLKIPLDDAPGRPPTKLRHNSVKKR